MALPPINLLALVFGKWLDNPIPNKQITRYEKIELVVAKTRAKYPKTFRLVLYYPETGKVHEFITNNSKLAASNNSCDV